MLCFAMCFFLPAVYKYRVADVDKLRKHMAVLAVLPGGAGAAGPAEAARSGNHGLGVLGSSGGPRVVAFCNTGERSGATSLALTELLAVPVRDN